MHNRDKFPYDVAVGITFRTDKEIPVIHEVLRNYFQSRNKQKHYFLTILGNPHILIKCILIDICVLRSSHRRCSRLYQNETPAQVFSWETSLVFTSTYFEQHLFSCAVWSLGVVAYKYRNTKNKNLKLTFFSLPRNREIGLFEEDFEESCFNKSVDLGRRLKNSKD